MRLFLSHRRCFSSPAGLFSQPFLQGPASFSLAAAAAARTCGPHVAAVSALGSPPAPAPAVTRASAVEVLRRLDAISDALCRVLDAAEAARSLCASPAWRSAAEGAHGVLSEFMFSLNGHVPLHGALVRVTECAPVMRALSEERAAVAAALRAEFERDGIGRPRGAREAVAVLQAETARLAAEFAARAAGGAPAPVDVPRAAAEELPAGALAGQPAGARSGAGGTVRLLADPCLVAFALRRSPRAALRAALLRASHAERVDNVETLEALRRARGALARAAGARSYADMACGDRLAGGAEGAVDFLRRFARALLPHAAAEVAALSRAKAAVAVAPPREAWALQWEEAEERAAAAAAVGTHPGDPLLLLGRGGGGAPPVRALQAALCTRAGAPLQPWDVHYFSARLGGGDGDSDATAAAAADAAPYLSLAAALGGLRDVMRRVFGVAMERVAFAPGEGWAGRGDDGEGLLRFDLRDGDARGPLLGTLYLDPFERDAKAGGAAHYVVRCGKQRHGFDGAFDAELRTGGGAGTGDGGGGEWQLPVVVLALNFAPPAGGLGGWGDGGGGGGADAALRRTLLNPSDAETLFHEWGHAAHSLLSRTEFQHLSGTRGALDFVEVPSHLFEHWAREWGAVRAWAAHWETGAPLPRRVWARVEAARARGRATELLQMTAHALFDLALFASRDVVALILEGPPLSLEEAHTLAAVVAAAPPGAPPPPPLPGTCLRGVELCGSAAAGSARSSGGGSGELPSTALLQAVQERYLVAPPLPGSAWHGGFTHVCTYGAGFYSYLFATVISAALWQRLFAGDPFCSRGGALLRRELLEHGGAKNPAAMLRACLGEDHASLLPLLHELGSKGQPELGS
jgi:intermediate peptidase